MQCTVRSMTDSSSPHHRRIDFRIDPPRLQRPGARPPFIDYCRVCPRPICERPKYIQRLERGKFISTKK